MAVEQMPTGEYRVVQQREPEVLHQVMTEARTVGDFRLLAMLIGALVAGGFVAITPHTTKETRAWLIFLLLAALLGAASGEAFGFGLSRWFEVKRYHVIVKWRVWLSVLTVLALTIALVASTPLILGKQNLTGNGALLSAVAIFGALSSAASLAAIKQAAADPLPGTPGEQLDALLRLRRMAARMLSQLGLLVLLVMGVNAAALGWGKTLDTTVVIFSGAIASFAIATMYVPTAATLRRRGALYIEQYFSLADVPRKELIGIADERLKLEKMLSVDQTTFGELKAGLVVLSPVVVSLVASVAKDLL